MIMKILVDLNVILDVLHQRKHHAEGAAVLDLIKEEKVAGFVSAHEITTLSYFLSAGGLRSPQVKETITTLLDILKPLPVDEAMLKKACLSEIDDYEDAVIEAVALRNRMDYIVTRNIRDFSKSQTPSVTPADFLAIIRI